MPGATSSRVGGGMSVIGRRLTQIGLNREMGADCSRWDRPRIIAD